MSCETTAVKQRCAKCGLEIDNFAANPGMWPIWTSAAGDNGAMRVYHQQCVIHTDELERLRADNAQLKLERDEANLFRERNRVALNRRDADLQAHKDALEKAESYNERLKGEVERAKQERNAEGVKQRNIYLPQLKAHRDALIEAGKALEYCKDFVLHKPYGTMFKLHIPESAIRTISELLQKGSVKS